jgi:hypothetical protein
MRPRRCFATARSTRRFGFPRGSGSRDGSPRHNRHRGYLTSGRPHRRHRQLDGNPSAVAPQPGRFERVNPLSAQRAHREPTRFGSQI